MSAPQPAETAATGAPRCAYCGTYMHPVWIKEREPFDPIIALVCPKCFSTFYAGDPKDPFFVMTQDMQRAIGAFWESQQTRESSGQNNI